MGRDFTPAERFLANKESGFEVYLQNLEFQVGDSKGRMYTEEEQAIRLRYKICAVAMSGFFLSLYRHYPEEDRHRVFEKLEKMIGDMEAACLKGKTAFFQCDVPETMKDWFLGRLDKSFHYCEQNDQMFKEWVMENVK